jgi:hypothetical protein
LASARAFSRAATITGDTGSLLVCGADVKPLRLGLARLRKLRLGLLGAAGDEDDDDDDDDDDDGVASLEGFLDDRLEVVVVVLGASAPAVETTSAPVSLKRDRRFSRVGVRAVGDALGDGESARRSNSCTIFLILDASSGSSELPSGTASDEAVYSPDVARVSNIRLMRLVSLDLLVVLSLMMSQTTATTTTTTTCNNNSNSRVGYGNGP